MAQQTNAISTGLAMFSMFFGAGNVVFPLALGHFAKDQASFAILGLLITAVGVPFLGLIAMTLFDGDYKAFFARMGKTSGFIISAIIMGLIGPLGAIPRCIALSFSVMKVYLPSLSLPFFSLAACAVIFLFTYKKSKILDVLGNILTPFLMISLGILIAFGLFSDGSVEHSQFSSLEMFIYGLKEGYQTMDLLGAFFFCSVVLECLRTGAGKIEAKDASLVARQMMTLTLKASCIGAALLAVVYIGFCFTAALHGNALEAVSTEQLIGTIAKLLLGNYGGIIAGAAVALACLTTAIALCVVFADYIYEDIAPHRVSYHTALIATLIVAFSISTLNFTGIVSLLAPILYVCYPALIVLSVVNIGYKLWGFTWVKTPVAIAFFLSLINYACC